MKQFMLSILLAAALTGCGGKQPAKTADEHLVPAAFCADSAYAYVSAQVAFGPRVPGSEAHALCRDYLVASLESFGLDTRIEQGSLPNYANQPQRIYNIIGSYRPDIQPRILLCAHWDSRPWCDQESTPELRQQPVLGANDGASGVGVLLEVARQLSLSAPSIGVDIIFFDAEDMGTPDFYSGPSNPNSWCLGSQLWATNYITSKQSSSQSSSPASSSSSSPAPTAVPAYTYGILLDMVGSPDAVFPREYFSQQYASSVLASVWQTASQLGFGRYFQSVDAYPVTDDHYYINTIASIPTIDIIHYDRRTGTGFPEYWHTAHDDLRNISPSTLHAVGTALLTHLLR